MKRTYRPILLLCTLLGACTTEGLVEISLAQSLLDQTPGIDSYSVLLLDDGLEVIEAYGAEEGELPANLATLSPGSTHRMRVLGFAGDGAVASKGGLSQPLTLREGETQRVMIPFSSRAAVIALPRQYATTTEIDADGSLAEWFGAPSVELDHSRRLAGPGGANGDFWATLRVTSDATWLHVALEVRDDCPALVSGDQAGDCGTVNDAVDKLYFGIDGDGNGLSSPGFDENDFWIEVSAQGAVPREGTLGEDDIRLAMGRLPRSQGWVFEASIRLSGLGRGSALVPSDHLGLGLLVVDADPGDTMVSTYGLSRADLGANSTVVAPNNMLGLGVPDLD